MYFEVNGRLQVHKQETGNQLALYHARLICASVVNIVSYHKYIDDDQIEK